MGQTKTTEERQILLNTHTHTHTHTQRVRVKVKGTEQGQKIKVSRHIVRKEMKIKECTNNDLIKKDEEKTNRRDCSKEKKEKRVRSK